MIDTQFPMHVYRYNNNYLSQLSFYISFVTSTTFMKLNTLQIMYRNDNLLIATPTKITHNFIIPKPTFTSFTVMSWIRFPIISPIAKTLLLLLINRIHTHLHCRKLRWYGYYYYCGALNRN